MDKCLFIYNPFAGKGKIKSKEKYIVDRLCEKYEVEVYHSKYAGNIKETLLEKGENFSLIVAAGGDGTLNEIVDSVMRLPNKPRIGYIPSGTVNDVAHSLYIPRKLKKAVDNILNGTPFSHDIMKINDRYGIYVCAVGMFTDASYVTDQKAKKKIGKMAYMFHGAKSIFKTKSVKLKVSFDSGEIEGRYAIFLINNSRYTAGMPINKYVNLNDGLVDIILVESKKEIVKFPTICKTMMIFVRGIGHFINKKHIHHLQLSSFKVEIDDKVNVNLDGERLGCGTFEVNVIKSGVEIIVPKIHKLQKQIKNV